MAEMKEKWKWIIIISTVLIVCAPQVIGGILDNIPLMLLSPFLVIVVFVVGMMVPWMNEPVRTKRK